ncbi:MAG: hypothetical protein H6706_30060 [Myxococcales bacterium]|nr:hypothetical protein [Myxococcales bacterium]
MRREDVPWSPPRVADLHRRLQAVEAPLADAAARLRTPPTLTRLHLGEARVPAWHCVAEDRRGPVLSLATLDAEATADEVEARAVSLALGCALFELPLGAAAGAIAARAATPELGRAWHRALRPDAGRLIAGGPPALVAHLLDAHPRAELWAFSNAPVARGGLPERAGALARGAFLVVQAFARRARLRRGARVVTTGASPEAAALAELLRQAGYDVAAPWAPPPREEPAPPPLAPGAADADVLVVATPHGLHPGNAAGVTPRLVVELAVGGVAADLDEPLMLAAVPVLPDFLVRGGEAVAAACEGVPAFPRPDDEAVRNLLAAAVERAIRAVWEEATSAGKSAREAALALALRRLTDAE